MPSRALQPFLFSLPEQVNRYVFFQHDDEELLYVLTGVIGWHAGRQKFILEDGDTTHFGSRIPHRDHSLSDNATALVVMDSPAGTDDNPAWRPPVMTGTRSGSAIGGRRTI